MGWHLEKASVIILIPHIPAKITGITPFYSIPVFQRILGTSVIWIPAINTVHPSGVLATVKFIQIVDT